MDNIRSIYYNARVGRTIKNLKDNGFNAIYAQDAKEAKDILLNMIEPGMTVGVGGSITVRSLGIVDELKSRGNTVFDHWEKGLTPEEVLKIRYFQLSSDVFISSTNAITETGALINIDSAGNRVASMIFGPKKVIIVAGANKIVENIEEGMKRAQNVAAPLNSIRLNKNNSCNYTGVCNDCKTQDRICKITTIIERKPDYTDFNIILVADDIGY
ncbi:MAG: lactate utilization protein [Thermoanaerobacteraceae bacterium]|nr:lactate utilization protein [Thermoanaerobacteraceae bacterium]